VHKSIVHDKDTESIMSDSNLINFIMLAKQVYIPIIIQAQLAPSNPDNTSNLETPFPNECKYFYKDQFDLVDKIYNPVVSDSENELYLIKFGKHKAKCWPYTDHRFKY